MPTPWLSDARVTARLPEAGDRTAELRASYRFRPGLDTARLTAARAEGTRLELASVGGVTAETPGAGPVRWQLDTLPGLLRLRVPAADLDELTLTWRIEGATGERIPLFVPATPTRPAESRVRIEVEGGEGVDLAAGRVFPRMRTEGGLLVGSAENLPSFLLLPRRGETLTVDRLADWSVVLLVLVATGWWIAWRRREARRRARREEGT